MKKYTKANVFLGRGQWAERTQPSRLVMLDDGVSGWGAGPLLSRSLEGINWRGSWGGDQLFESTGRKQDWPSVEAINEGE